MLKYIKDKSVKEVTIIGGSHSGFSCAWMLLNGPAMFDYGKPDSKADSEEKPKIKAEKSSPKKTGEEIVTVLVKPEKLKTETEQPKKIGPKRSAFE